MLDAGVAYLTRLGTSHPIADCANYLYLYVDRSRSRRDDVSNQRSNGRRCRSPAHIFTDDPDGGLNFALDGWRALADRGIPPIRRASSQTCGIVQLNTAARPPDTHSMSAPATKPASRLCLCVPRPRVRSCVLCVVRAAKGGMGDAAASGCTTIHHNIYHIAASGGAHTPQREARPFRLSTLCRPVRQSVVTPPPARMVPCGP